ncbi:aminodeoxychorismate lyase [Rheinheimera maricola]|uniref:Aminodeoxychorismate lyase n=1 Tax=Rheinheimera maricola TaxID=2793282 RepID=A0ABS7XDS1_9GAMM|nr:aminodeoxychorismate lyase [Rheinheimera maricola]
MSSVIRSQSIGIKDRSFNYGDGIFTTMQVRAGEIQLWPLHLQRLQASARQLGFTDIDWLLLQQQALAAVNQPEQVIKILISRGEGGRGYGCDGISAPHIYISVSAMPDYKRMQQQGVCLQVAKLQLAVQPLLAGLKHTSRLEQVLLKQELANSDADELLVLDQHGFVTEASAANVFMYRDGRWHTPTLARAGVAGVMRQHIMQQADIHLVDWLLPELANVDALFICNALMAIVPVSHLQSRPLSVSLVQEFAKQVIC